MNFAILRSPKSEQKGGYGWKFWIFQKSRFRREIKHTMSHVTWRHAADHLAST